MFIPFFLFFIIKMKASPFLDDDPMESTISGLINQMTLDEKCSILHGSGMFDSPGISRLGIPGFVMVMVLMVSVSAQ